MTEKKIWEGIATKTPALVILSTSLTRRCWGCRQVFEISKEEAVMFPLGRIIWYCSVECSLD